MNIFSVLSMGKSRLHETSMSAMLAYLLSPNQDHGIGNKFLKSFLELSNSENTYSEYIEVEGLKFDIDLEVQYNHIGWPAVKNRSDIDIQIKIMNSDNEELHRILIENKIKVGAANPDQLKTYYERVLGKNKDNDDNFELGEKDLSIIFLTPESQNKILKEEFESLEAKVNKVWITWNSTDDNKDTVLKLIQKILELEQKAEISPINEYMKHTFKAFAYFINYSFDKSSKTIRSGDIGNELIDGRKSIKIDGSEYEIVLRDSGQIQLFNDNGEKVQARPLLKKFIKEKNIEQKYDDDKGTTRQYGKQIFNYLNKIEH